MSVYHVPQGADTRPGGELSRIIDRTVVQPGFHAFHLGEDRHIVLVRGRLWGAAKRDGNAMLKTSWDSTSRRLSVWVTR